MKRRFLTLLVALVGLAMASAQSLLVGDTNQDGELTVADVTETVKMVVNPATQRTMNMMDLSFADDNQRLVGTWYKYGTQSTVTFYDDGRTNYLGGGTYKFRPLLGRIVIFSDEDAVAWFDVLDMTDRVLQVAVGGSIVKYVKEQSGTIDGHEYVDLGLPSGTLWATCNVGASSPEQNGDFFAWGETVPYGGEDQSNAQNYATTGSYEKTTYDWTTYKWCEGTETTLTKYCRDDSYGLVDGRKVLAAEDDAATQLWGSDWCVPTDTQMDELRKNCTWTDTTVNGVTGVEVKSWNGKSIFLPLSGYYKGTSYTLNKGGFTMGYYWASTFGINMAYSLRVTKDRGGSDYSSGVLLERYYGCPIRPVRNQ